MGAHSIRYESIQLKYSEQVHNILIQVGWMEYFELLDGFDNEVALEFTRNLDNGTTMVRNM